MTPEQAAEVLREVLPDAYNMSFETSIVSSDLTAALETAIECLTTAHPATPTLSNESESLEEIAIACLSEIHKDAFLCSNNDEQHIFICGFVAGFNHATPTPTDEQIGKLFDQHTDVSVLLNPISPTHAMTRTAAIRFARELLKIK